MDRTERAGRTRGGAKALDAVSYGEAEALAGKLELASLTKKIGALDAARIKSACTSTERRHAKLDVDFTRQAKRLEAGTTALVPISWVRPGQVQISFENVRAKMLDFIAKLDVEMTSAAKEKSTAEKSLLAYAEALDVVVGPGGKYLVLVDGHHHIAGLKAVDALVHEILGDGIARGAARATWKPGRALQRVHDLFTEGGGVPLVPLHVIDNASAMPERDFWKMMRGGDGGKRLTYLVDRSGKLERVPPKTFGGLEDNPYRYLASVLTGKISRAEDPKTKKVSLVLAGAEYPVWMKDLDHAPPFLEFAIARVLEDAFRRAGLRYDPQKPLGKAERRVARAALHAAKGDPESPAYEALKNVLVLVREVPREKVARALEEGREPGTLTLPKSLLVPSKRRRARWAAALPNG